MTRTLLVVVVAAALAACRSEAGESASPKGPIISCDVPRIELSQDDQVFAAAFAPGTAALEGTRSNFLTASGLACHKGYWKGKPLTDPAVPGRARLTLVNAPEANVASIYRVEGQAKALVLEYPFLTSDGKTNVPSSGELEEAIYCAVRGATPEAQESSGRCLVD